MTRTFLLRRALRSALLPVSLTALYALSTLGSAACSSPRRRWQPGQGGAQQTTTTGGGQAVATTGVVASGSPREQLDQLDGVLRQQGYAPTGPAVHGNLQTNGLIAYAVDARLSNLFPIHVLVLLQVHEGYAIGSLKESLSKLAFSS